MPKISSSKSINGDAAGKPSKPYPDFPLTANGNGQWSKKIRGKVHYFGKWEDWRGALDRYLADRDDLQAGRKPKSKEQRDGLTVRDLCNRFLTSKARKLRAGEIVRRTFDDYHETCGHILAVLDRERLVIDLEPEDFAKLREKLAEGRGPVALTNEIRRCRVVFNYAFKNHLVDRPAKYGEEFSPPSERIRRENKNRRGPKMFEADEVRRMLDAAPVQLRALILLGCNAAFSNADAGTLPKSALDLEGGWLTFPRNKTAVPRRIPLWPETAEAIRLAIESRPEPKNPSHGNLVFLTKYGEPWHKETKANPLASEIRKLAKLCGIVRPGTAYYGFRHIFETIGGDSCDQVAVDAIMGHAPSKSDMAAVYRERVSDERLQRVVDHVRAWLWPEQHEEKP